MAASSLKQQLSHALTWLCTMEEQQQIVTAVPFAYIQKAQLVTPDNRTLEYHWFAH